MAFRAVIAGVLLATIVEVPALTRQSRDATTAAQARARAAKGSATIAGRVIQADGVAAEGARVAVYSVREGAPAAIVGTGISSHDGRYEIAGLPAGRFVVGVTPQRIRNFGGDSRRLTSPAVETFYPGTTKRMEAEPIAVLAGVATEGIDVWLEPAAQRYSISGRLFGPEGVELENVVIEYGGPDGVHHGVWYVPDVGGLFTLEGASRGTYVLLARADAAGGSLMGLITTNIANDSVHDVRLALRPPGRVEGRIVVEGKAGPDLATLRLVPTQTLLTASPLFPEAEATPDATGRFTLSQLLGEFTLNVRGLPDGWRVRRVTRAGAALPNNRIPVMPGERVAIEVVISNTP